MEEKTVIERIVKYSKDCFIMRFTKSHLLKSHLLLCNLPSTFIVPSAASMKTIVAELEMRIAEREKDIEKLLTPLFEKKDFGYKPDTKHSLSVEEIRAGYISLNCDGEEYVILLKPFLSKKSGMHYNAGVLYKSFPDLTEKELITLYDKHSYTLDEKISNIIIKKKLAYEYLKEISS